MSIATLLDKLTHHADVTMIEGHSYNSLPGTPARSSRHAKLKPFASQKSALLGER